MCECMNKIRPILKFYVELFRTTAARSCEGQSVICLLEGLVLRLIVSKYEQNPLGNTNVMANYIKVLVK